MTEIYLMTSRYTQNIVSFKMEWMPKLMKRMEEKIDEANQQELKFEDSEYFLDDLPKKQSN